MKAFWTWLFILIIPQLFFDNYFHGFQGSCYAGGFIIGSILEARSSQKFYRSIIKNTFDDIYKTLGIKKASLHLIKK